MPLRFRIHLWTALWVDVISAGLGIMTLTLYRPEWGLKYRLRYAIRELKHE